jgi:predicted nucleotidyltransferase
LAARLFPPRTGPLAAGQSPRYASLASRTLYLFGSYARDEARPDSDIDDLCRSCFAQKRRFSQIHESLSKIRKSIGGDVDLGYSTRSGLSRYIREQVEHEAVWFFDGWHQVCSGALQG